MSNKANHKESDRDHAPGPDQEAGVRQNPGPQQEPGSPRDPADLPIPEYGGLSMNEISAANRVRPS